MHDVLNFLLLALYIVSVIAGAAFITWLVVRISPTRDTKAKPS